MQVTKSASAEKAAACMYLDMTETAWNTTFDDMSPAGIGARLGRIRRAFQMEKAQIADLLEIDRPHWSRFENGVRAIPYDKASRLVDRFGVSLDFIYLGRFAGMDFEVTERLRRASAAE